METKSKKILDEEQKESLEFREKKDHDKKVTKIFVLIISFFATMALTTIGFNLINKANDIAMYVGLGINLGVLFGWFRFIWPNIVRPLIESLTRKNLS